MKKIALLTAAAAMVMIAAQPQAAEAKKKHHKRVLTYPAVVSQVYPYNGYNAYTNRYLPYGYGRQADFGGATVFPDGSFTNNGVSWNGADPTGGATGVVTPYNAGRLQAAGRAAARRAIIERRLFGF